MEKLKKASYIMQANKGNNEHIQMTGRARKGDMRKFT